MPSGVWPFCTDQSVYDRWGQSQIQIWSNPGGTGQSFDTGVNLQTLQQSEYFADAEIRAMFYGDAGNYSWPLSPTSPQGQWQLTEWWTGLVGVKLYRPTGLQDKRDNGMNKLRMEIRRDMAILRVGQGQYQADFTRKWPVPTGPAAVPSAMYVQCGFGPRQ